MTHFFRKLRHSLTALLGAWVACNLAWWLGAIPALIGIDVWQPKNIVLLAFIFGLNSGLVLLGVSLLLILPLEWLFKVDWSRHRARHGALRGFLVALPFALLWVAGAVFLAAREFQGQNAPDSWEVLSGTTPYVLATLAAGTAFGWARARAQFRGASSWSRGNT